MQAGDEKADGRVSGLRVLVVEDEFLVAMLLEDMLGELGHRVIGPIADAAEALAMAQRGDMEVAILDLNLAGTDTYPIAAAGSADFVLTFRNIHNWMATGDAPEAFAAFFRALKPGGVLGLEEHRARPDAPQDPLAKSGYVREDFAIALAEAGDAAP